jgi:hypothetical protein
LLEEKVIKWKFSRVDWFVCVRLASQTEPLALFSLVAKWYIQFVAKLYNKLVYNKVKVNE